MLVFEQSPLPLREFQITSLISAADASAAKWPPYQSADAAEHTTIEQAVAVSERSEQSTDIKNARLLGMVAATYSIEMRASNTLCDWGLLPHLGMMNALGASLVADLPISDDAIYMASAYHIKADTGKRPPDPDKAYASPGSDSLLRGMEQVSALHSAGAFRLGVAGFIEHFASPLDTQLKDLPPGPQTLATYAKAGSTQPAFKRYIEIQAEVEATRQEVVARQADIDKLLTRSYGYYQLQRRILIRDGQGKL
jgi:hypothetical protein